MIATNYQDLEIKGITNLNSCSTALQVRSHL